MKKPVFILGVLMLCMTSTTTLAGNTYGKCTSEYFRLGATRDATFPMAIAVACLKSPDRAEAYYLKNLNKGIKRFNKKVLALYNAERCDPNLNLSEGSFPQLLYTDADVNGLFDDVVEYCNGTDDP